MMTKFDAASIMLYSFPAEYYLKGKESPCFIENSNTDISRSDKVTIENMYPVDVSSRMQSLRTEPGANFPDHQEGGSLRHEGSWHGLYDFLFNSKGIADEGEDKDGAE